MKQTYSLSHFLRLIFNKNHRIESKKQSINQHDETKKPWEDNPSDTTTAIIQKTGVSHPT